MSVNNEITNNNKSNATTTSVVLKMFKAPNVLKGLVLYFHPYNYYSQKVLLTLYEKNIEFSSYVIDLANGEQYSTWFLNLNPKGDVPVLQDDAFIITESSNIINYVEDKFRTGRFISLKPSGPKCKEYERVEFYEEILNKLPIGALSLGSFIHHDLKLKPKDPFIGSLQKNCLKNNEKVNEILKKSLYEATTTTATTTTPPINKSMLLKKLELHNRRKRLVSNREEFQKLLDVVENVLRCIDNDIKEHPQREWLISSKFYSTDISLGLLLHRLYQLGYEDYFWSYGKMPYVESYFLRFRKRETYQKLLPNNNYALLKDIWHKASTNYLIGAGAGVLGMAMFAALAHK